MDVFDRSARLCKGLNEALDVKLWEFTSAGIGNSRGTTDRLINGRGKWYEVYVERTADLASRVLPVCKDTALSHLYGRPTDYDPLLTTLELAVHHPPRPGMPSYANVLLNKLQVRHGDIHQFANVLPFCAVSDDVTAVWLSAKLKVLGAYHTRRFGGALKKIAAQHNDKFSNGEWFNGFRRYFYLPHSLLIAARDGTDCFAGMPDELHGELIDGLIESLDKIRIGLFDDSLIGPGQRAFLRSFDLVMSMPQNALLLSSYRDRFTFNVCQAMGGATRDHMDQMHGLVTSFARLVKYDIDSAEDTACAIRQFAR